MKLSAAMAGAAGRRANAPSFHAARPAAMPWFRQSFERSASSARSRRPSGSGAGSARVDINAHISEKEGRTMFRSRVRGFGMGLAGVPVAFRIIASAVVPLVSVLLFGATPALADFRVCNATQNLIGVAIGYRAATGWITEGWWHVEGSTCKTLIEGPLSSRYYYLYAEDAERGGRWDGPVNMCVAEKEFKITGVGDCVPRGFQRAGFQEYDTGEQASWMVQLTDEPATDGAAAVTGTGSQ